MNGGEMKQLNDTNFESSLTNQKTIIMFSKRNCAACNQQKHEIMKDGGFVLPTYEVKLDENPVLCSRLRILHVPKTALLQNKKIMKLLDGLQKRDRIIKELSEIE
jgi:thioredoxin-like negative regulator of GroEL